MNVFKQFYAYLHLRYAVRMADDAFKQFRHRFYVIPGDNGELTVTDRKNFRGLNRKHWIRAKYDPKTKDVKANAFYYTPYADGSDTMPSSQRKLKQMEYYDWWEKSRNTAKAKARDRKAKERERKANIKKNRRDARRK